MPFPEVKPNIKKVFLINVIKVVSVALIILLLAIIFFRIVGVEFFQDVLAGFDITINIKLWHFVLWVTLAVFIATLIILILNYLSLGNVRYEFQPNKIVYYYSLLFVLLKTKDIPYRSIIRINFDYETFLDKLFNTGTITIELSAMKEKEFKMGFIDNAEQVARYIQKVVQDYRTRDYMQRAEEYKIDDVFNRGGL